MFSGSSASSAHNSLLNAMISSNFSQIFSTTHQNNGASFVVSAGPHSTNTSTTPLLMAPPPSYAEAMLNAKHQHQYQQQQQQLAAAKITSPAISLAAIASPDILRLAADTTAVSLRDVDEEDFDDVKESSTSTPSYDEPLDLSLKNTQKHKKVRTSFHKRAAMANNNNNNMNGISNSSPGMDNKAIIDNPTGSSSTPDSLRSSVIHNLALPGTSRNTGGTGSCEVKRSYSSVSHRAESREPDVCEHFRRSLSGKWPRRQPNYAHYISPSSGAGVSIQQQQQAMRNNGAIGGSSGSAFGNTSASSSLHSLASSSVGGSTLDFCDLQASSTPFRAPSVGHSSPIVVTTTSSSSSSSSLLNHGPSSVAKSPWQIPFNSSRATTTTSSDSVHPSINVGNSIFHPFNIVNSTTTTTIPIQNIINNNNNNNFLSSTIKTNATTEFITTSNNNNNNNKNNLITTKPINGNYRIAAKIIINEGRQVEDHFRKALGELYQNPTKK